MRESVRAALSDPAVLKRGVEAYEANRGATDIELQSSVAHLAKQIAKVRADERRLIGLAVDDGEQRDVVEAKLRALAQRRRGLATQLAPAEDRVARHGASSRAEAIERLCRQAKKGLAALTTDGWRSLLLEAVDHVKIRPDGRIEIHGFFVEDSTTCDASALLGRPRPRAAG